MATSLYEDLHNLIEEEDVALIPVDEKTKAPCMKGAWKGAAKIDYGDLIHLMDNVFNTTAVAMVLGRISDNLVCIDIDTKYKSGFDAIIFSDIKTLYPDVWDILRIEKTPSGGYHILFRIEEGELPGCFKAAERLSTPEEIDIDVKRGIKSPAKTKCFLEVKCEGGLSQCYPSPGYSKITDRPIPTLSEEESSSLISLCRHYNEVVKVEVIRSGKDVTEFYDESPYEHFDKSEEGSRVLDEAGWKPYKQSGHYLYYQKPDKKDKNGVSASFNLKTRLYTIFTAGSSIEPKTYSASNLKAFLDFGDNKKELYSWLIAKGYGKIKAYVEKQIIKRAARRGGEIPANVSEDGKKEFQEIKTKYDEKYPFGTFWTETEDGVITISREALYSVSESLGFRLHGQLPCVIKGYIVELIEERDYFDRIKNYINAEDENYVEVCNCYEAFLQKSGKFTISRLMQFDIGLLLKSNKDVSYKPYRNGYVKVTSDKIELIGYESIGDRLVWKNQIQDRDFVIGSYTESLYYQYLDLACGVSDHLYRCIGYYAHDYKATMTAYIVILCEMVEDARKGGGSGKNIFTNLLRFTTTLLNKPGKNVKFDDTMLRTWKGEHVMSLNDLDKKFDFLGLKELSTGEGEVGKKFMQEVTVANEDMPKFICNTNFSFDASQPGLKRRLVPLEFTDFFSVIGGVDVHFGKDFPSDAKSPHDWTEADWIGFDNVIMLSIQKFIKNKCKLTVPRLTNTGWIKQFEEKFYGLTHQFIIQYIDSWLDLGTVPIIETFNKNYNDFVIENNIAKNFVLSSQRMNDAIEVYCEHYNIEYIKYKNIRTEYGQKNCKCFKKIVAVEEETIKHQSITPKKEFYEDVLEDEEEDKDTEWYQGGKKITEQDKKDTPF